jgi:hypothetical protein
MLLRCRIFRRAIEVHLETDLKDGLIDLLVKVGGVVDQNSVILDDVGEVWPVEALPAGARMGVRVPMMEIASAGIGMGMHRSAHQLSHQ